MNFKRFLSVGAIALIATTWGCKKDNNTSPYANNNSSQNQSAPPNQVYMKNLAFSPNTITVPVNTTVKWTNQDGVTHTVTSNTGLFDSGNIPGGGTFIFQFTAQGTFPYHCKIHNMQGTIIVQ
jgi:plastocyanin